MFKLVWYPFLIGLPSLAAAWLRARRFLSRFLPVLPMAVWPFALLYLVNDVVGWVAGKSLTVDGRYDVKLDFPRVELRESLFAVLTAVVAYLWWRTLKSPDAADVPASRQTAGA